MSNKGGCIHIYDRWLLGLSSLMHLITISSFVLVSCTSIHQDSWLYCHPNFFVAVQEAQLLPKDRF
jgi:hypothetical protein